LSRCNGTKSPGRLRLTAISASLAGRILLGDLQPDRKTGPFLANGPKAYVIAMWREILAVRLTTSQPRSLLSIARL
jgi:hypothetical protein